MKKPPARLRAPMAERSQHVINRSNTVKRHSGSKPKLREDEGWPKKIGKAAYYGLIGDIVRTIEPHTEADPANLMVSTLLSFGNAIGRSAWIKLGPTRHYANNFAALVGDSARGRKGTGLDENEELYKAVEKIGDTDLWTSRIRGGLSTGEGMIAQLVDKEDEEVDKRLMLRVNEFAALLTVMCRPDNTMSPILRGAWDSGNLEVMTRNNPLRTEGAHVSLLANVTTEELRKRLSEVDRANGFANRFLFVMVRQTKFLPHAKRPRYEPIAGLLLKALRAGSRVGQVRWAMDAKELWEKEYVRLSIGPPEPLLSAVTARSAQHVARLAMIYALTDGPNENRQVFIREEHLRAALEVWRYCEDSARYIFGSSLGDDTADKIMEALRKHDDGLTRAEIYKDVFNCKTKSEEIQRALNFLASKGLAEMEEIKGNGRTSHVWYVAD
jgi:hypothetical protein